MESTIAATRITIIEIFYAITVGNRLLSPKTREDE
jgi:hypothetical protein